MKKLVFVSSLFLVFCLTACNSKQGSQEEKNEIKSDSVDIVNTTENIVLADTWPDIKMLADLVRQEKTEPQLNDAPFISYLVDSIGFKEDTEYHSYCRKLKESNFKASWLRDSDTIRFDLRSRLRKTQPTEHDSFESDVPTSMRYGGWS